MVAGCRLTIRGALCEYCRQMAPVSIPRHCYSEEIGRVRCVSLEEGLSVLPPSLTVEDEYDLELCEFESLLNEKERIACRMKQLGYSNRDIMPVIGVWGDPQMTRLMRRIQKKAIRYFAPEVRA